MPQEENNLWRKIDESIDEVCVNEGWDKNGIRDLFRKIRKHIEEKYEKKNPKID